MFCPNCGHKVDPDQKFCDNCGWALKKNNAETTETKDDDSIRSLSEIEKELNQEDPSTKKLRKNLYYNKLLLKNVNTIIISLNLSSNPTNKKFHIQNQR
jgi:Predicted nucleic-acid-binding protein containing a Zn-ribbon